MQAIEFIAKVKNGTIEIPKEYLNNLNSEIRVIILLDQNKVYNKKKSKKNDFLTIKNPFK